MLFNNDAAPVIQLDESRIIIDCNSRDSDYLGMTTEDIKGRSLSGFLKTDCGIVNSFPGEADYFISRIHHYSGVIFKATLPKPYTVRELFESLNEALER